MFYVLIVNAVLFVTVGVWALVSAAQRRERVYAPAPVVFAPEDSLNIPEAEVAHGSLSFDDDPDFSEESFSSIDLAGFEHVVGDEMSRLRQAIVEDESKHKLSMASHAISSNSFFMLP